MKFLKENWIWIVAPIVIFAVAVGAIVFLGSDPADPDRYNFR